jgi:hypothetical protein
MMTSQQIVNDVVAHVGGNEYSAWYAGIATDARDCLFNRHKVDEESGSWIFRTADSNAAARDAEDDLHSLGFDGGPGGGDSGTLRVHAYRKTAQTSE